MNVTSPAQVASSSRGPWSRIAARVAARGALGLMALGLIGGIGYAVSGRFQRVDPLATVARRVVHRTDMGSTLTASGLTESASNTIISCELERLDFRTSGGAEMSTGGASVIIELVDEGTMVKKGDVLCRLDSSDYEELVRQQQIKVDQARTSLLQSQLDLEVAELAVREEKEGRVKQWVESMEGEIVLFKGNLERAQERLDWTTRMLDKGYASQTQRAAAERNVTISKLALDSAQWDLDLFNKYGSPKSLKVLMATVEKCRFNHISNDRRLTRMVERLQYYQKMVEFCTIKAPHDGFLVYATDPWRPTPKLEVGSTVRQAQKLFFLPNLDTMNVLTYLHESVAHRVHPGMATRVTLEGLGNATLPGRVVSVAPLPVAASSGWLSSGEIKFFIAVVKLDRSPAGIRPGLTAHVAVDVDRREDVLAIPSEAVAIREGRDVCYVAGEDGIERRSITIGRSTKDLLEVTSGLAEGEEVVMQPERIESIDQLVVAETAPEAPAPLSPPLSTEPAPPAGPMPTVD